MQSLKNNIIFYYALLIAMTNKNWTLDFPDPVQERYISVLYVTSFF